MPSFEGLLLGGTLLLLALGALGLFAVLRRSAATPATDALGRGSFAEALARAQTGTGAGREELFAAAVAAKHLLDLDQAAALLDRLIAADPGDGEAWLERGLVSAYSALAAASPAASRGPAPHRPGFAPGQPAALPQAEAAEHPAPLRSATAPEELALPQAAAEAAVQALARAIAARSDLAESITLHRAWLALLVGDLATARHLFDEVEAPLETKLRSDLGEGEPLFAEWFLHAADLWDALGEAEKAHWARRAAREAAPESRLPELLGTEEG